MIKGTDSLARDIIHVSKRTNMRITIISSISSTQKRHFPRLTRWKTFQCLTSHTSPEVCQIINSSPRNFTTLAIPIITLPGQQFLCLHARNFNVFPLVCTFTFYIFPSTSSQWLKDMTHACLFSPKNTWEWTSSSIRTDFYDFTCKNCRQGLLYSCESVTC